MTPNISKLYLIQFEYALDPTYTYYRFLQHQTLFTGGTALERTVGNGSAELALSDGSNVRKTQLLFTAAELNAAGLTAGNVHGLRLDLSDGRVLLQECLKALSLYRFDAVFVEPLLCER